MVGTRAPRRPRRTRRQPIGAGRLAALGAVLACSAVVVPNATAGTPRFPRWPTEVDRVASPIYSRVTDRLATERHRADAVVALDAYATPVIVDPLLFALDDPSLQVRREALRLCFERSVPGCIDGAATLYNDGAEPSLRIAALKVLGLDDRPRSASILVAALRDPSEAIRAQAAELIGTAPLPPPMADKARAALLAKLPDVSAVVRRAAVRSLGLLGPGDGALAIARVLDDPEPNVRAAAAAALGRMRDGRVVPALRRAVQAPNEPIVAKALVEALARLETADGEADLLALIDDPPPGLNAQQVADAIARRRDPGPALIEGLIERLREPPVAAPCLHALLLLGEATRPSLQAALSRGVEAPIAIELRRLLAALEPPAAPTAAEPWPEPQDTSGWIDALAVAGAERRLDAGLALGAARPAWLGPTAGALLASARTPGPRRAWLVAVARATGAVKLGDAQARAVARLVAWAADPTLGRADRCLAVAALGTIAAGGDRPARDGVRAALSDARPQLRACAAAVGPKAGLSAETLEGLLVDPDARTRVNAALAIASYGHESLSRSASTRLAVMEARDPSGPVRTAAASARARARRGPSTSDVGLLRSPSVEAGWAAPHPWHERAAEPEDDGAGPLWLPVVGFSAHRWVLVPGEPDATVMSSKYSLSADINR